MDEFKGLLNLVLLIIFVAASVLGPAVERWRRRKEKERRAREISAAPPVEAESEVEPPEAAPSGPKLPYEEVLHELFGPYVERRRREAEEAKRRAEAEVEAEAIEVVEEDEEPVRPPAPPAEERRAVPIEPVSAGTPAEVAAAVAVRRPGASLDERLFRNPRLSPGAKLVLAAEILGRPRSRR